MGPCTQAGPEGTSGQAGRQGLGAQRQGDDLPWSLGRTLRSVDPPSVCVARGRGQVGERRGFGMRGTSEHQWSRCPPWDMSFPGLSPHSGARGTGWSWVPSAGPVVEDSMPRGDTGGSHPSVPVCRDPIAAWLRPSPPAMPPACPTCPRVTSEQLGSARVAKPLARGKPWT